jgi:RimJ/RimL family protein N-acetyltransferase
VAIPEGFVIDRVSRTEVEEIATLLRLWYPDIRTGMESPFLDPDFFFQSATLKETLERSVFPLVMRYEGRIVAFYSAERNELARTVWARLSVVAPDFRRNGLNNLGPLLLIAAGEGAALAWATATLSHPFSQKTLEKAGYQLVGIVPAYDRDEVAPGDARHVYEALYAKTLVGPEGIVTPCRENMTPETRRLWDFLFAEGTGRR